MCFICLVLWFNPSITLKGKVCIYNHYTILLNVFPYEKYFRVSQWLFLSAIFPWKIAPGWVLPKGKLSPLARQEGKCKGKPWPTITEKSTVEVSHLSLATGLDLVINGRHLRLMLFFVQVSKIKALGNVSPKNEEKKKEVEQYSLSPASFQKLNLLQPKFRDLPIPCLWHVAFLFSLLTSKRTLVPAKWLSQILSTRSKLPKETVEQLIVLAQASGGR